MATKRTNRTPKKRREWKTIFLDHLRETLNVKAAAAKARIARQRAYEVRDAEPEFAAAWDRALVEAIETAEGELYRRAVLGVRKPVYQGGKKVGAILEYSDSLLQFLLKSHKPGVYRETTKHETWQDDVIEALLAMTSEQRAALYADLVRFGFGNDAVALFALAGISVSVADAEPVTVPTEAAPDAG